MAEGWIRHLKGEFVDVRSAGTEKRGLDPRAVRVMAEAGVDISNQYSKLVEELEAMDFDYVITLCDHARESCPFFPGSAKLLHVGFDDPPALARDETEEDGRLKHYRRVRDEIRAFVESLPDALPSLDNRS